LQKLNTQRHKRSAASYLRNTISKSLARFSSALYSLSQTLADPAEQPTSAKVVNSNQSKLDDVPLPPSIELDPVDFKNFVALTSGSYSNIGITPCFINREASAAIVAVRQETDHIEVYPMFVALTHSMKLLDQNGEPLTRQIEDHPEALAAKEALDIIVFRSNGQ
jgi:hypothetical protein